MWSRIHLIPVLQAEEDRDLVRRHWAQEAREKELLGAETKVYNNDRCVPSRCRRNGARKERHKYKQLTTETGGRGIVDERAKTCHVVNIAGILGRFSIVGNHQPMHSIEMFIQMFGFHRHCL
jgi:hypothetical protein